MPLPSTRIIPPGWSQHHAEAASGGANATVQVRDPAAGVKGWDDATESATWTPAPPVYDRPARIQQLESGGNATVQAEQSVTAHRYLVQLAFDAPHIEEGWEVVVTQCVNDADLVAWTTTRPMTVIDVQHGSERFTRDLVCSINLD